MYLQTFVLPKWEKYVGDTDLPEEIEEKYRVIAELMSNYLDNQKIRKTPLRLVTSWVNTHFAAENDNRKLLINRLIAKHFSRFISNYRSQDQGPNFPKDELHTIIAIQQELDEERKSKLQRFTQIKAEVERLRKERRGRRKALAKPKKRVSTPKTIKQPTKKSISFDTIYSKWMKYVEDKQNTQNISKSYWYIHEYIARYIIKYAKENNRKVIDENTVQAFLDNYGKGKRPKTMNHYNRVAKYFLEFCLDLQKA